MTQLNIFDIQRCCFHDGPGIRTVVFFQGCPLHCPWCANPESQKTKKHLLHFKSKCTLCGECIKACPENIIVVKHGKWQVDRKKCTGCEQCAKVCLQSAVKFSGEKRTVGEILEVVERDWDYYETSQGGLTISGGEPFAQPEGLVELLRAAKEQGLHTAVETCGHTSTKNILTAEPHIDLFLYDIKHHDIGTFRRITGGDLPLILGNLDLLAQKSPEKVVLRVPVIPGFNNDIKTLEGIFTLAKGKNLKKIELLPYHTLGKSKYIQMGLKYQMGEVSDLTSQDLEPYRQLGMKMGLNT